MKIISLLFISMLTFVCGAGSAQAAGIRLENPSFEVEASNGMDQAESWSRWGQWFNRETDWMPVRQGRSIMAYHHWEIEGSGTSGIWQDVEHVKQGRRYRFRIYANADSIARGKQGAQAIILRLESTLAGRQVVLNERRYAVGQIATGGNWSPLEVLGTSATDTLRVLVIVTPSETGPRDGAVKFDQADLQELR